MPRLVLLAVLLTAFAGCAGERVDADRCNLTVLISPEFATHKAGYSWWPDRNDSIYRGHGGGSFDVGSLGAGGDGRSVIIAIGVVVAVALVLTAADVTAHNVGGVDIALEFRGPGAPVHCALAYGENRFLLPDAVIAGLRDGTVQVRVVGTGTRKFAIDVPFDASAVANDVNYLEFTPSGNLIVNGRRL